MAPDDAVHVVGGSIASLVAADALATSGRAVVLHLPERGVGAGFLPVVVDGVPLDLGSRLIELSYDDEPGEAPSLDCYRPGPHGHRPFLALVDAFVRALAGADLVPVAPPQFALAGRVVGDVVLGGDLRGAPAPEVLARIAAECEEAVRCEGPSGLFSEARRPELWTSSLADASRRHTGATFHDLVMEPLAQKILPGGSASVIAALHRRIWLPLFHPATVRDAARGEPSYVPDRPAYTLANGGMGAVVRRLLARIDCAPTVSLYRSGALVRASASGPSTRLEFEHGAVTTQRPVLGVAPPELFAAAGIEHRPAKMWATIAWLEVAPGSLPEDLSVRFVGDPTIPVFRVTRNSANSGTGAPILVCELSHDVSADDAGALAIGAIDAAGIAPRDAVVLRHAVRVPATTVPDHANLAAFAAARCEFDSMGIDVDIVGGATAFAADSFNEQVVQGLRAAQR